MLLHEPKRLGRNSQHGSFDEVWDHTTSAWTTDDIHAHRMERERSSCGLKSAVTSRMDSEAKALGQFVETKDAGSTLDGPVFRGGTRKRMRKQREH